MNVSIPNQYIMRGLYISSGISILLNLLRIAIVGYDWFSFLIWNLFLAWIPLGLSILYAKLIEKKVSIFLRVLVVCGWLLFFPNAPYIITDLMYLDSNYGDPYAFQFLWFDGILIVSYVINGLLLGFVSLRIIHRTLAFVSSRIQWLLLSIVLVLTSFGIYLGRYLRWNSWDIVHHPLALIKNIFEQFQYPFMYSYVALYSVCLVLGYVIFCIMLRGEQSNK